jgi:2-dehydropantoate 2-reductase
VRYLIMGAGGVGGVIAGGLMASGREVALIARGEHLRTVQEQGLRLITPDGEKQYKIPAFGHPSNSGLRTDDVVILAMKSQDTDGALDALEAAAPRGIGVVCAQNGVANEQAALRRFADVYAMSVVVPGGHLAPGVVIQWSSPCAGILDLGRYPQGEDERAHRIASDLDAAGFRSEVDPLIMRKKYRKLLTNLLNALEALCGRGARNTDLASRVQEEGRSVLHTAGIDIEPEDEERASWAGVVTLRQIDGYPYVGSSSNQSLIRRTGSIEADWLNGEIVLLGRLHQVPTPLNELLQREANAAAREHRPPGSLTVEELVARL